MDWAATSMGPPSAWPQSLRSALSISQNTPLVSAVYWGPELRMLYNDAFARSLAERHPWALGRPLAEVFADIKDVLMPQLEAVVRTGVGFGTEHQLLRLERAGHIEDTYWVYSFAPIRGEGEAVVGVFVNGLETTAQVFAERRREFRTALESRLGELAGSGEIMSAAAELLGGHLGVDRCGYGEVDRTGEFLTVERAWTASGDAPPVSRFRLVDFGPDLIAQLRAGAAVQIDDQLADQRTQGQAAYEGVARIRAGIVIPLLKDQRLVAVFYAHQATPRLWSSEQNQIVREVAERTWAAVERSRAENALRELNETLERRVAERGAQLIQAEDALRQSRKLEAMGQLTGGVAHDFNNLLSPIIGGLDMLQRRHVGGEREQRLIEGALQSAERAKLLVQRLLAFARRQPLLPTAVDVGSLVNGMAALVASTLGPQIQVTVEVSPDLPPALADANQLEMALLNLSVNARDAMADGGTLRISAVAEAIAGDHPTGLAAGQYVRLSVADSGKGMDAATLARAIEPFFSTKGVGKGTGLGLSMVHGLASQLGGAMSISSSPGLGANVELWLPVSPEPARTDDPAATETRPSRRVGVALLVEDEPLVRQSTAAMLANLGYEVIEAGSAEDALRTLEGGTPVDLLITDHVMPGMTGVDLARAVPALGGPAVLIVSGFAETEDVAPDLPRLIKPFRQSDLAAALGALRLPQNAVEAAS